jgi:hypothetical protein
MPTQRLPLNGHRVIGRNRENCREIHHYTCVPAARRNVVFYFQASAGIRSD